MKRTMQPGIRQTVASARLARPALLLLAVALLISDGHESIYYKTSSLDNIEFTVDSIGTSFIRSATDTRINDPTSTKQNVNSTTGLVVLASDSSAPAYFHNLRAFRAAYRNTALQSARLGRAR